MEFGLEAKELPMNFVNEHACVAFIGNAATDG